MIRNQDYELNIRLRQAGGTVWFDPELWVGYRPRGSWRALATQYYEYGYWKAVVLQMHPDSARLRQLVPPIAIAGVLGGLLLGRRHPAALLAPGTYWAVLAASAGRRGGPRRRGSRILTLATTHLAWSTGFVVSAFSTRSTVSS